MSGDPYPPFSGEDATCPKCGESRMSCEFHERGTRFLSTQYSMIDPGAPEWMLRQCGSCGYGMPEMCADRQVAS